MHSLALLAAMLLAFAPSISKLVSNIPTVGTEALCTSAGLKNVELATEKTVPDKHGEHADCGYCTLLTSASAALPSMAMHIPSLDLSSEKTGHHLSPFLVKSNFPALGSRGPPAV